MLPHEITQKRILIASLDWGLGHVTRSMGIIRQLLEQGNEIFVACDAFQENCFRSYFPEINYLRLEGYGLQFSGKGNWSWDLWQQRKFFIRAIRKEQEQAEAWCQQFTIDLLISDHRYGFYAKTTKSVFVTHQLHLPISPLFFLLQKWHEKQLSKFNALWVLDDEQQRFAGNLSKAIQHPNLHYIGVYSRFQKQLAEELKYDYLIVVSGPKPYSELLLDELNTKLDFSGKNVAVLYPDNITIRHKNTGWEYFPATNLKENDVLFYQSNIIVSRSGYSTIMDLQVLGKKGILFPTKGQKEQEYLYQKYK